MGIVSSILNPPRPSTTTSLRVTSTSIQSSVVPVTTTSAIITSAPASTNPSAAATSSVIPSSITVPTSVPAATGIATVGAKILIIATDDADAYNAYSGLQGYGIPYEVLTVPSAGVTLPTLNSSSSAGNYGGIVIYSDVSYEYPTGWSSALTAAQWQQLYDYQTNFGVRMVRLDVYPGPQFGTTASGDGCCATGVEQLMSFTNTSSFATAGLKTGATVSTQGLWHYPASITDANTWQIAKFGPGGSYTSDTTAAVLQRVANGAGTRQQMAFFISMATSWNTPSNFLMHSWIDWVTRGLYVGTRRILLSTQIDDVFLGTGLYEPAGVEFRVRPADLQAHVPWMASVNSRLPRGSNYFVELGHNGAGNIENATQGAGAAQCNPADGIYLDQPEFTGPLEFKKELGTGTNYWPTTPATYSWSLTCSRQDPLLTWLVANVNSYGHVSHTFTHMNFNNATYSDASKEMTFNQAWFRATGIGASSRFSANGLIPPAITGMHNGDVIKAFLDNGIKYVVGDNTRPPLMNPQSGFWPLTSNVADNGYPGLEIIPRWATTIYYNCDLPDCNVNQWTRTSAGSGGFEGLLNDARTVNMRHLLGLHQDPFMFHQANMRQIDAPAVSINGATPTRYSLLQSWVEVIVQELVRLTDWPVITLKHDDIAAKFIARRTRDQCSPQLSWTTSADRKSIVGATVTANGNRCGTNIPVTFPGRVTSTNGGTSEQLGSDPLTVWTPLNGAPVTFTLASPVAV